MSLGGAFISYGVKFILFSIVAGIGIWSGIKLCKINNGEQVIDYDKSNS